MKTQSYILCFFLCVVGSLSFGQQKRVLDWQDFKKSLEKSYIADPVDYGSFAIFEIRNINRFLFKVEIEGKKVSLQTPIPTELQSLFRLDSKQVNDLQGTENKEVEDAKEEIGKGEKLMQNLNESIDSDISSSNKSKNELNLDKEKFEAEIKAEIDKLNGIPSSDTTKTNPILRKISTIRSKLKTTNENLNKIKFKEEVEKVLTECAAYIKKAEEVSKNLRDLKIARLQLIVLSQEDIGASEMRTRVEKINFPSSLIVEKTYNEFIKSYSELEELYEKAKLKAVSLANNNEKISKDEAKEIVEEALENIEKGHQKIKEEDLLSLISDVLQLSEGLKNEKNFRITSPPVQMDDDIAEYNISIIPTQTRTLGVYQSTTSFKFDIPTRGGLKVDFSVGPILSFGNGSKDDKYYFEETTTGEGTAAKTETTLRKLNNQNSISPSIAAMMHFYGRSGRTRSFGGLFGVGVGYKNNTETPKTTIDVNVLLGLSAILGKREKLMLNGGVSWLRVDRLKTDQFKVDGKYLPSKVSISDMTEKVFRPSLFFSISYNLTNRVQRN